MRTLVAFLGPEGTYSHAAARSTFGGTAEFVAFPTIHDTIKSLEKGTTELAIIPLENSQHGSVLETLDSLALSAQTESSPSLRIVHVATHTIRHALLTLPCTPKSHVRTVISHEQALAQCASYISRELPLASKHAVSSTAAAAQIVSDSISAPEDERCSAAIGSSLLRETFGLEVIADDIQDSSTNRTRFALLTTSNRTLKLKPLLTPSPRIGGVFFIPWRRNPRASVSSMLSAFDNGLVVISIDRRPDTAPGGVISGNGNEDAPFVDVYFVHVAPPDGARTGQYNEEAGGEDWDKALSSCLARLQVLEPRASLLGRWYW